MKEYKVNVQNERSLDLTVVAENEEEVFDIVNDILEKTDLFKISDNIDYDLTTIEVEESE